MRSILLLSLCAITVAVLVGCQKPDPSQSEIDDLCASMRTQSYDEVYDAFDKYSASGLASAKDSGGWTLLHFAAFAGDVDTAQTLIENGADVNAQSGVDGKGPTPLHQAVKGEEAEIARLLIEKGADINRPTYIGETPLHWAAQNAKLDMVTLLVESGADINVCPDSDGAGCTPLLCAAVWNDDGSYNADRAAVVEYLVSHGAKCHAPFLQEADVECLRRYGISKYTTDQ